MVTVSEVAARTGLSERRVRALIAAGAMPATKVGARYLLDDRDVDAFVTHDRPAHVRAFAPRVAWAAASLLDGVSPVWLGADERSRLRARLASADGSPGVWRAWTARLASTRTTLRASAGQVEALLVDADVVRSGRSASNLVTDPLVGPVGAQVWVRTGEDVERLRSSLGLLRSASGNVTVSVPSVAGLPALGADGVNAFRLVVATDLLAQGEAREGAAGRALLEALVDSARRLRA